MKRTTIIICSMFVLCLGFSLNCFSQNTKSSCDKHETQLISNKETKRTVFHKNDKNYLDDKYGGLSSYISPSRDDSFDYVYTPNGTPIEVLIFNEMTTSQIEQRNLWGDQLVPEATRIGPSSARYNCHSYAWYMQSTSNTFWMNYPTDYYSDGSYEISTGEIGDIICYFDEYGENLHSGIVINKSNGTPNGVCGDSNLVTVRSKWGAWGLYEHRGDQCPYTSTYGGDADYVMYFKPRTNDVFNLSNPNSNMTQNINTNYSVPTDSTIFNNYALYGLNIAYAKSYGFEVSSINELNVRFYDEHMHLINVNMTDDYENGIYSISFSSYLNLGKYYLRVSFDGDLDSGVIYTEIINSHLHSYDFSYSWRNYTQHYAYCNCGSSRSEGHVVFLRSFSRGNHYAQCALCGGLASVGFDGPLSLNNMPMSLNGSYILPNGVVVLVDEDFDAYLDGTLVFIYPNIE